MRQYWQLPIILDHSFTQQSLVMTNSDPQDRSAYPYITTVVNQMIPSIVYHTSKNMQKPAVI